MVDIAARIRARLSRRRHSSSTAPSLSSSRSGKGETSSLASESFIPSLQRTQRESSLAENKSKSSGPSLYSPKPTQSLPSRSRPTTARHEQYETVTSTRIQTNDQEEEEVSPHDPACDGSTSVAASSGASASATALATAAADHHDSSDRPNRPPTFSLPITHKEASCASNTSPTNSNGSETILVVSADTCQGGKHEEAKGEENGQNNSSPRRITNYQLRAITDTPSRSSSIRQTLSPGIVLTAGLENASVASSRPQEPIRRQSLLSSRHANFISSLLQPATSITDGEGGMPPNAAMTIRKIWVKRPGASATLVPINEDDLVDDVRDMILRKYANSLGRTFDSPDLTIRIHPREQPQKERTLGPEEHMCRTLEACFPGGQTVEEALIIDIPRRTPKASPRAPVNVYYSEDGRPPENGEGYFPPVASGNSPHLPLTVPVPVNGSSGHHSIAVLGTGHIPPIPSPGGTTRRAYKERPDRPRLGRTHTSSPTVLANGLPGAATGSGASAPHGMPLHLVRPPHSRTHSNSSDQPGHPPAAPPLPKSPTPMEAPIARTATPPIRTQSPRPQAVRKRTKKPATENPTLPQGLLNGGVPPINVLIVEDNPINLKLLEAFVKRLKVRWQTAMNGRDAVKKWRTGGFHLVLMDIQLPVMNGLDATREIRRLERVNSIGVFSSSPGTMLDDGTAELKDQDKLENLALFKSPVIIVALTASSLQSDRHEALAAGCNDFLTKPVNFVWLERKVMEWGCMQALIDFDGWRKWKDFSQAAEENETAKKAAAAAAKTKTKKHRSSITASAS